MAANFSGVRSSHTKPCGRLRLGQYLGHLSTPAFGLQAATRRRDHGRLLSTVGFLPVGFTTRAGQFGALRPAGQVIPLVDSGLRLPRA